ncbi:cytochrome P450 [Erwinia pyri]|uniref:Cytochrome P450 n=1 Tax=Erwinia pyri TaxID=3062598 RepID=A0AA50DGD6_9GAMM|nr:cytochrome P450 [Erwinia sp. DE2]WLS77849.1 cytochrome P450 [Erwinia sp. DE2]
MDVKNYYITDIPDYDSKPGYEVISAATYERMGRIRLLSGHEAFHVINYHDVKKILQDKSCIRSPSNEKGGPSVLPTLTPKEMLLNLDYPEHTRMKQFIARDYSFSGLKWLEDKIAQLTQKYAVEMESNGQPDLFTDLLDHVAADTNCVLLGIPCEDQSYFRALSHTVQVADPDDVQELVRQFELLYSYVMEHVQGKRHHTDDGLIARFINNRANCQPPLNDNELTAILLGALLGGDQNTLTGMTKIIYGLLHMPDLWEKLHEEKTLIPDAVEEMLRLTNLGSTSTFPRIATQEIQLATGLIPAGAAIFADVFLANRDPAIFPDPLLINPGRENKQHLQFGYGMHHCMGQELVRLEIKVVVGVLTRQYPQMRLRSERLNDLQWSEGIVLRRPDELPVIL